jgi:hypothetical protein
MYTETELVQHYAVHLYQYWMNVHRNRVSPTLRSSFIPVLDECTQKQSYSNIIQFIYTGIGWMYTETELFQHYSVHLYRYWMNVHRNRVSPTWHITLLFRKCYLCYDTPHTDTSMHEDSQYAIATDKSTHNDNWYTIATNRSAHDDPSMLYLQTEETCMVTPRMLYIP